MLLFKQTYKQRVRLIQVFDTRVLQGVQGTDVQARRSLHMNSPAAAAAVTTSAAELGTAEQSTSAAGSTASANASTPSRVPKKSDKTRPVEELLQEPGGRADVRHVVSLCCKFPCC